MSVTTITPIELAERCKEGRKIDLIDVRTPTEFQEVHLQFARNVPLDRLDPAALMNVRAGSEQGPLFIICRSGSRGRQACEKFLAAGFTNIVNVDGGTLACLDLPGKRPATYSRQENGFAGTAGPHRGGIFGAARLVRGSGFRVSVRHFRRRIDFLRRNRHVRHRVAARQDAVESRFSWNSPGSPSQ